MRLSAVFGAATLTSVTAALAQSDDVPRRPCRATCAPALGRYAQDRLSAAAIARTVFEQRASQQ